MPSSNHTHRESESADPHTKSEQIEEEILDEQLDKELEDSFPASDPPSLTQDQR